MKAPAFDRTKRQYILGWAKVYGYHEDPKAFTSIRIENPRMHKALMEAYAEGYDNKVNGMKCNCDDCKEKK